MSWESANRQCVSISTGANRLILVDAAGARIIREQVATKTTNVTTNQVSTVTTLQEQLQAKDRQIEALQQSLNDTTAGAA